MSSATTSPRAFRWQKKEGKLCLNVFGTFWKRPLDNSVHFTQWLFCYTQSDLSSVWKKATLDSRTWGFSSKLALTKGWFPGSNFCTPKHGLYRSEWECSPAPLVAIGNVKQADPAYFSIDSAGISWREYVLTAWWLHCVCIHLVMRCEKGTADSVIRVTQRLINMVWGTCCSRIWLC